MLLLLCLLNLVFGFIKVNQATQNYSEGCVDGDKEALVDFHAHVQKEVTTALMSLVSHLTILDPNDDGSGNAESAGLAAVKSYLGTLVEEINNDLYNLGVQINLIVDHQSLDEITANGSYDPSCELASPVKVRTQNELTTLRDKLNEAVGIHFYIYSCVYLDPSYDMSYLTHNNTCGRVLGIMWKGSVKTKVMVKSLIIEALTGVPGTYQSGTLTPQAKDELCNYVNTCIGRSPSQLGLLLDHRVKVGYTQREEASDARLLKAY